MAMDRDQQQLTPDGSVESDRELAVKVAVHIRPLIGLERLQGCKDCIIVIPGEPQVQIGHHSFTFDHVYGNAGSPSSNIFEDCVAPLVDGLFQGYNATVLAYGQTGSGKTYTMGTGYTVGGSKEGVIPLVMETIFNKVQSLEDKYDFQIRVAFIEILKEEIHDLLDPTSSVPAKVEALNAYGGVKPSGGPGKPPIQIRETPTGGIMLAGVTETSVNSLEEMATCLEQGSLCRATGSTNMNSRSSRSHAIFTITLEQRWKSKSSCNGDVAALDDCEEFLCAKLHLVDLAGSERAKRTGADGIRFKEGVHINKGLLALGNVISALGDEKRRKEGGHVPYRDSKLTRLLQDSLGGNSRTVMIACVSPADSNAEETLNTLKYANRARNIQNKPVVNRDPMAAEVQRLRQQLELLHTELMCVRTGGGGPFDDIQILKDKITWLEASNTELRRELEDVRINSQILSQRANGAEVERDKFQLKFEQLRSGKTLDEVDDSAEDQEGVGLLQKYAERIQELENQMHDLCSKSDFSGAVITNQGYSELTEASVIAEVNSEEEEEKELEHEILQDSLDKELQELNRRLEQKEAEMKSYTKVDGMALKQHFEKKLADLEDEKRILQRERDSLLSEIEKLASASDEHTRKMQETYMHKLKELETQINELKKKQENQANLMKQKQRSEEAAKRLNEEIMRIKQHKVQLQNKMKQESEQFRLWKASREKEVLQLRKEGRKNEFEMHKLQALHQRQKMVLQRKTEEAAMATRRLKELLEARKPSFRETAVSGATTANGPGGQINEKALKQWVEHELEVAVHTHQVRVNYEKQTESRAMLAKELAKLKEEEDAYQVHLKDDNKGSSNSTSTMSPNARVAKIRYLEGMLNASSNTLVAMASQLSEAEERERGFNGRARWQHLRAMAEAKSLLQNLFDKVVLSRCELWDIEMENQDVKKLLQQSETKRKDLERQQYLRDQSVTRSISISRKTDLEFHIKRGDASDLSEITSSHGDGAFPYDLRKASRVSQSYSMTHQDDEDSSEDELDMELDDDDSDLSDEDWNEDGERRISNRTKKALDRPKNTNNAKAGRRGGCEMAVAENLEISSASEKNNDESARDEKKEEESCCSCSQSSGCKTKKCECRALAKSCGSKCGCRPNKCANREASIPTGLDEKAQSEVVEALETLRVVGKSCGRIDKEDGNQGGDVVEAEPSRDKVEEAEQVLARHGAAMLGNALKDENTSLHHEHIQAQRRPLSDIGNIKEDSNQALKPRNKWQKAVVQIVETAAPPPPLPPTATATAIAAAGSESSNNNAAPESTKFTNVTIMVPAPPLQRRADNVGEAHPHPHTVGVVVPASPSWQRAVVPIQKKKKAAKSPHSSPLKARNSHPPPLEGGGGAIRRIPSAPTSPRKPHLPGSRATSSSKENV